MWPLKALLIGFVVQALGMQIMSKQPKRLDLNGSDKRYNIYTILETVDEFKAVALGSSAFLLSWKKPHQPNGKILGYNIYYSEVNGTERNQLKPQINSPYVTQTILGGLKPETTYRLFIAATTNAGEIKMQSIVFNTKLPVQPDVPSFTWTLLDVSDGEATIRVNWKPKMNGNPGSCFYVSYRTKGQDEWIKTGRIVATDTVVIILSPIVKHEMVIASVDGKYMARSDIQLVLSDDIVGNLYLY
ncbi:neuroglian-like isoform X2 [Sitodiplosis mosellana]|uniref:neuroglian-like isoform X2 n=1 Tax=Sitodiplosis mosellana TaxID=263140 RepID=UPI00244467D8|nr:neuroglian-like isoform X2 [Sitodiplosis mosellana]